MVCKHVAVYQILRVTINLSVLSLFLYKHLLVSLWKLAYTLKSTNNSFILKLLKLLEIFRSATYISFLLRKQFINQIALMLAYTSINIYFYFKAIRNCMCFVNARLVGSIRNTGWWGLASDKFLVTFYVAVCIIGMLFFNTGNQFKTCTVHIHKYLKLPTT